MNTEALRAISRGQKRRSVSDKTTGTYLSRMSTISKVIVKNPGLHCLLEDNPPTYHIGEASKVVRLKFPVTSDEAQDLFAAISVDGTLPTKKRRTVTDVDADTINLDAGRDVDHLWNPGRGYCTVTSQTYQNYKSAFKWWHKYENPLWNKVGCGFLAEVDDELQNQIHGYKKDVGAKKRDGVMQQKEGKSNYNTNGYLALCDYFNSLKPIGVSNTWREGLFSASFTKFSTATIGRSDNVDDIALVNIDCHNDALRVKFVTTKNDRTGETTSEIKRLFANPFLPSVCCHLDLIVNVLCRHPHSNEDAVYLYGGREQNKRYYKELVKAMKEMSPDIDMGCNRCDIGTHSNRKFAESMAVSKVDGPNRTQVCLRAGQSVGRVQDCYMKQEDDGDALTGRTVALLKINADEFDVLPPHFSQEVITELYEYGWGNIVPGFDHYPESFQRAIRFTFPSLVYHFHTGKLNEIYCDDHPLWRARLFTYRDLLMSLKDKIIIAFGHCELTQMYAEGIPALVTVCREIREESKKTREELKEMNEKYMQLQNTVGENHGEMKNMVSKLPKKIVDEMLKHLEVNGAVPVTRDNIQEMLFNMINNDNSIFQNILNGQNVLNERLKSLEAHPPTDVPSIAPTAVQPIVAGNDFFGDVYRGEYHLWPGIDSRFHSVYAGFMWPSDTAFTMWELWWRGDPNKKVCPYRHIDSRYDLTTRKCQTRRTKTLKVINLIIEIAIDKDLISCMTDINCDNSTEIFDSSYSYLITQLYVGYEAHVVRASDLNICTLANRVYTKML